MSQLIISIDLGTDERNQPSCANIQSAIESIGDATGYFEADSLSRENDEGAIRNGNGKVVGTWKRIPDNALKRYSIAYTRRPTHFNTRQSALVDAESPEVAMQLLMDNLGDRGDVQNHSYEKPELYEAPKSRGQVFSVC
jgi:hypothetical protein